jgi:oligosaccharide repeat unit polymerase
LSIPVALGYCILNTGRTWFFMLLIVLMGLALLSRKISARKALIYSGTAALLLFVTIAVLLGKGGSVDKPLSDNAGTLWDAFQTYLLGPLPSFDIFVRHHQEVRLGDNTLRFFWAALDKLGFNTPPVPLVHEFVNVPFPSNVYTVYRPYFDDFGLLGAVMVQFFIGLLHGGLYRKLARADAFYYGLYAFSLYPLAMQFFQDQYLSLLSLWFQTVVVLLLMTRLRRQQHPEPEALPATSLA